MLQVFVLFGFKRAASSAHSNFSSKTLSGNSVRGLIRATICQPLKRQHVNFKIELGGFWLFCYYYYYYTLPFALGFCEVALDVNPEVLCTECCLRDAPLGTLSVHWLE